MNNISRSEAELRSFLKGVVSGESVFLDSVYLDRRNKHSFFFSNPEKILTVRPDQNPDRFFKEVSRYLKKGFWVAGYFTYEFGYLFEPALAQLLKKQRINFPLAWLGVFGKPVIREENSGKTRLVGSKESLGSYKLSSGCFNTDSSAYAKNLKRIKFHLSQGNTYQVNSTIKYKFTFKGDTCGLYLRLRKNQPTSYSSFINDGKRRILCCSPELFFRRNKDSIVTRPMKGTYPRGETSRQDTQYRNFLKGDAKNRAENIMIVDLLRNDLGRICRQGSVGVSSFFDIEAYPSLFQMTSTIKGKLSSGICYGDIFRALFPSGSVTGAPKIRTMQIIHELEKEPRDVYTGSIGFISPSNQACFNVAIRTLIGQGKKFEFGVGGGIVYDSEPESEYQECKLKAKFLTQELEEESRKKEALPTHHKALDLSGDE